MTVHRRLNNPESCIICARRADGIAVGRPDNLGWFCEECGLDRAKEAIKMPAKQFDIFEKRACEQVAELCGTSTVTLSAQELPDFIQWAVENFAEQIRAQVQSGKPPF